MHPSRRSVLTTACLGLAAACTGPRPAAPLVVNPDDQRKQQAAVREEALIQLYDSALVAFPALAPVLSPLREDHLKHYQALVTTPLPTTNGSPTLVGPTAAEARRRIVTLERATAAEHATSALVAGPVVAPLLASLSACEASHAEVL